jgi:hypothetical protein
VSSAIAAANKIGATRSCGSSTSRATGMSASIRTGTPEHSSQVSRSLRPIPSERVSGGAG